MKRVLFLLCLMTVTPAFATNWTEQPGRYKKLRDSCSWEVPSLETEVDSLVLGIINVWGSNRKGRTPSAIRSTSEAYHFGTPGLHQKKMTLDEKQAALRALMATCEERFVDYKSPTTSFK